MNSFFQSDSIGGVPVSPHTSWNAPSASPFSLISHKRANGQTGTTSSKKPREMPHNAPPPNAAPWMQCWPYLPGPYQLAQSIAQMEMVTPMSPVSPIRQSSPHLSPFPTPPGMMHPHASPFPYYAPNYIAFHPGFTNVNPASFLPHLIPHEYFNNHTPASDSPGPFGSPFRSNSSAPSGVYGSQPTAFMGMHNPTYMNSPLNSQRVDRSTANIEPRFNESEDAYRAQFVLPEYTPFTPKMKTQQLQMFNDESKSKRRQTFATPPQTPGTSYAGSPASNGVANRRRQERSKKMSAAVPVLSEYPDSAPFTSEFSEYTIKDFGIEPMEIWPTDFPSISTKNIGKGAISLPMSARKIVTVSSDELWSGKGGVSAMPHSSKNIINASVPKEKLQYGIGASWMNRKMLKLEPSWSPEDNFDSNKENIPSSLLMNLKQEAVSTANVIPPCSNAFQRSLEHLRTLAAETYPKTLSFSMNLSTLGLNGAHRSPLESLVETHPASNVVSYRQAANSVPGIQNAENSETSTSGSIGVSSRRRSDDSTRTVPMFRSNSHNSAFSTFKWTPVLGLPK